MTSTAIPFTGRFSAGGPVQQGNGSPSCMPSTKDLRVVICTSTAFVVCVLASMPETASKLKGVIANARETIISRTEYAYDVQGRIKFMKLYAPTEPVDELVRTEFLYAGASEVPERTEITSAPEKKVR